MSVLRVRAIPDPVLRQKSVPVQEFDEGLKSLIEDLVDTMFASDGVGIAAPQVGILSRVIICCETAQRGDEMVLINPEIVKSSGSELGMEGCLSVPGTSGEVKRATRVTLKAQNIQGRPITLQAKDFFARILQHEIDHLNGILFIDYVKAPKSNQDQSTLSRL